MAISKTDVLNKALTLCGAATVVSIEDGTPNANTLSNVYDIALRSILSECKWNFATLRNYPTSVASGSANYPAFLYPNETSVYAIPNDMIRLFSVNPSTACWREENGLIISDTASLGIVYTYLVTVPSSYPSYFLEAFVDKLCLDIAYGIINSAQIAGAFVKKYTELSLPKAISMNSQTGNQQQMIDDEWTNAKYYNYGQSRVPGAVAI